MKRWLLAATPLLMTILGIAVFVTVNPFLGLIIVVGGYVIDWFVFDTRVLGEMPERITGPVDPEELRAYRESHPGASIGDALAAVERDRDSA